MAGAGDVVPGSSNMVSVSATWYRDTVAGERRLMVVMRRVDDRMVFTTYSRQFGWNTAQLIGTASDLVAGEIAVWRCPQTHAEVCVYAPSGGRLKMWRRDPSGMWLAPIDQVWSDGTPIEPAFGIALTEGRLRNVFSEMGETPEEPVPHDAQVAPSGDGPPGIPPLNPPPPFPYPPPFPIDAPHTFAAIPVATSWPLGMIELAWTIDGSSWTRLEGSAWESGRAATKAQPGLAYAPFDDSDYEDGRFYLSWIAQNYPSVEPDVMLITHTEGNDLSLGATSRRARWRLDPVFLTNKWLRGSGNVSLLFERGIDRNVRGAVSFPQENNILPIFFPFADGIFDGVIRDQNDFTVIRANLACSLSSSGSCPM